MSGARQPSVGTMAALVTACEEIYACGFVVLYPTEPHPAQARLLESVGALVGVSPLITMPRVFTPAEFRRWLDSQPLPSKG